MSVVKSQRGETKLAVLAKADELAVYTVKICSNEGNFPKRYRWCVTSKIVDAAIEINNGIAMANAIYVTDEDEARLRKQYQNKAIASTYAMLSTIDIAYRAFGIDSDRVKHWTGLIVEVQKLLRSWRKSDAEREQKRVDG